MGVWGRGDSGGANWSPGLLDRAETFAESNVTVSTSSTRVAAEGIALGTDTAEAATGTAVDTANMNDTGGFYFEPDRVMTKMEVYLDNGNGGGGLYVDRVSDGERLIDTTGDPNAWNMLDPGEGVNFVPGEEYTAHYHEAYPSEYDPGGYPADAADLTITDGRLNGARNQYVHNFRDVRTYGLTGSGTATVEWPMPEDVAGWDIIPFQAVEDGGTVEVYAIDPSDGTQLAGPLEDPGDISDLPRSTNVAVEVVLESPTGVENPRLEAVYRRRKIT